MTSNTGDWYMELTTGESYAFRAGTPDENPLETIDAFDKGDHWSMDLQHELGDRYPSDPDDNVFILVPKEDVADVYFEEYEDGEGPQPIEMNKVDASDLADEL